MEIILTDSKLSQTINNDNIVKRSDKGLVISNKNCWKFIPKENLQTTDTYEDGYYYTAEDTAKLKKSVKTEPFIVNQNKIENSYVEKMYYYFGLKNLKLSTIQKNKTAGFVSKYIALTNFSYITISVNATSGSNAGIEYYIIDGIDEIPLLPENESRVVMEKLFYNIPTRFTVNNKNEEPVLYEDGKLSDKIYSELTSDDYENHEYALTYKPGEEYNKYTPQNDQIKVKIIFRGYDMENYESIVINSIVINKYGGSVEWN